MTSLEHPSGAERHDRTEVGPVSDGNNDHEAHVIERCKAIFVTQEQFGDYKEDNAEVIGKMASNYSTIKWLIGLTFLSILGTFIVTLFKVAH